MNGSDTPGEEVVSTPLRGWAVLLLFRAQESSSTLLSYTFGLFLPFISDDLGITPLQAGLLQGIWWVTRATLSLPSGALLSRFRPVLVVLGSLTMGLPFLFLQAFANGFIVLLLARFFFVTFNVLATPARTLLLQQWAVPRQYAHINSVGLSQHSVILATSVSASALVITLVGSWRIAYLIMACVFVAHTLVWMMVAQERKALAPDFRSRLQAQEGTPLHALSRYPQGWVIAVMMFFLSCTWTAIVTFLPTFWEQERAMSLILAGPLLGFLYYGLIPGGLLGGYLARKVTNRKLLLLAPAALNVLFGLAITVTPNPILLMLLISGLGIVWVATPAINVLPFEFPGITPREVAVISSLIITFSGLGFAAGPVVTGVVAEATGSIQTGLITLCFLTGLGAVASLFYPSRIPGALARDDRE